MDSMSLEEALGQSIVSRKTFRDDDLNGFSIFETEFSRCEFVNCIFEGSKFGLSKFHGCKFQGCSFRDARLQSCLFNSPDGKDPCIWLNCDLSNAVMETCNLSRNRLAGCKGFALQLNNCDATEMQIKMDFHRRVSHRHIAGGMSCNRTKFYEAEFREQDLEGSIFKSCDLRGADFANCNLSSVNFSGSNLNAARLTKATLTGAALAHADIDELDITEALSIEELTISRDQQEKMLSQFRIRVLN